MLSVFGSILYLVTALFCARAVLVARRFAAHRWQLWFWSGACAFFAGLIAWRLLGVEDLLRAGLRELLKESGSYSGRRTIQSMFAGIAMFSGLIVLGAIAWSGFRRNRGGDITAIAWAALALVGMTALVGVRLISFHPIDALLYGALHLNWFADAGAAVLAAVSASYYARIASRRRPFTATQRR